MSQPSRALRIGNMAAARDDRPSAMAELLAAGGVDVLAVDMLSDEAVLQLAAERGQSEHPTTGYEPALLDQLEGCADRIGGAGGVRVVTNAGALDPEGLAARIREWSRGRGNELRVAHLDSGVVEAEPERVSVVRHGAFGIARALEAGADVVVTGRVSREALVLGAAAAHHGWTPSYLDALAGAVAVGHVLSGGPGATGVADSSTDVTRTADPVTGGFPVAEIATDGSCVVTKHPSALGSVTVGTVTDQLLDGVAGPRYLAPDVVLRLDSLRVEQEGTDRVRISRARGEEPPPGVPVIELRRDHDEATTRIRRAVTSLDRGDERHEVVLPDGERQRVPAPPVVAEVPEGAPEAGRRTGTMPGGTPRRAPLGSVAGVRFGIVADGANLAVWTWDDSAYAWLREEFTEERARELLGECGCEATTRVDRYELPNLKAVNLVLTSTGAPPDPGLGRGLAQALLEIPSELLEVDP